MSGHAREVEEHSEVVGAVDKVEGDRIRLTRKDDPDGSGHHHRHVPVSSLAAVEDGRLKLSMPADRAKAQATSTGGSAPAPGMGGVTH